MFRLASQRFSRHLAAKPLRALSAVPTLRRQQSTATPPAAKQEEGLGSVIEKYGVVPFAGLGLCALVSKELLIVNEEMLLAATFGVFFTSAYVGVGQTIHDVLDKARKERTEKFNDVFDLLIEGAKSYQANMRAAIDQVPIAEQFLADQKASYENLMAFKNVQQRHAAREATVAKLQQIYQMEQVKINAKKGEVLDKAFADLHATFAKADAQLQQDTLNFSIELIGAEKQTTMQEDPVKRIASKVFEGASVE